MFSFQIVEQYFSIDCYWNKKYKEKANRIENLYSIKYYNIYPLSLCSWQAFALQSTLRKKNNFIIYFYTW